LTRLGRALTRRGMSAFRCISLAGLLASLLVLPACGGSKPEPEIASSAGQAGYAEGYPEALQSIMKDFGEQDDEAKALDGELPRYPDELKNPNWSVVRSIVESADEAGRSRAYVDRARETDGAKTFFDAEKEEISKKVAGSAQYVAKQKGCDVDVGGTVTKALEDAIEKQLEERLREENEAHRIIEKHRVALAKEAPLLEKQADNITRASYLVNIEMVEAKVRLNALLLEGEQVQKTLDDAIASERAFQGESGRTDPEKKASAERLAAMEKSRGLLSTSLESGNETAKTMDERVQAAQKRHADAMTSMKEKIDQRGKGNATIAP